MRRQSPPLIRYIHSTLFLGGDVTSVASTSALLQAWQDEATRQGVALPVYLDGLLSREPVWLEQVASCLGARPLSPERLQGAEPRWDLLPLAEALAVHVVPLEIDGVVCMVLADPFARATRERLQRRFAPNRIVFAISLPGAVDVHLKEMESSNRVMDEAVDVGGQSDSLALAVESITLASIASDESPIIRLVNMTLYDALQSRASDIHLEATVEGLLIRYRVDGVMRLIRPVSGVEVASQVMSRLKVQASLDIAEKRVPQDGRFKVALQGREIDLRVSIMPGVYGENAVLRILDKSQRGHQLTIDTLGFDAHSIDRIRSLMQRPHGLTLVTGPTGSGKSTTLYGALSEINTGDEKLITIEDPVEYELPGVLQIPVNEKKGLTFARGLRSILRHDPDTILVGEIRDEETASIAVQSALTGHRVLSSVHANDAFSLIDRFIYMGVEPSTFLEALNGIVCQRLVRRLCTDCHASRPDCETCGGSGFHGRVGLAEVITLDTALRVALIDGAPDKREAALARSVGYRSLKDGALALIDMGLTTHQEVQRAVALG
ncbi:GspE/PulE family protein [Burkholderia multivorans]|uniref:GspE/PulE family protein n=1 Tax=Burkholderia multivorans TaxID=87883 RepID=UPI00215973D2|nr:GspE/PulE family protein [Burkholderia multivorans]